jgi:hypothetical protein
MLFGSAKDKITARYWCVFGAIVCKSLQTNAKARSFDAVGILSFVLK